ncbi:MAG: hypothetical protein ACMZ63_05680 [Methylotenera sp.]
MHTYPLLKPAEQLMLPRLIAQPEVIHSKFEDSTHRLWYCETVDGAMVLKVCDHHAIAKSTFWQGANNLFGAGFPLCLGDISQTYTFLATHGFLALPDFIASQANQFVMTRYLAGQDIDDAMVTERMVIQLATHISQLHHQIHPTWGSLHAPANAANAWGKQLQQVLLQMAAQSTIDIPNSQLQVLVDLAPKIEETNFVPIMLDLRWDQMRLLSKSATNQLALIDLDAFVIGPKALELVLLEYLLTIEQFALFKQHYTQQHDWPEYNQQKPCYQLLLFLMNVLGERDLDRWMAQH